MTPDAERKKKVRPPSRFNFLMAEYIDATCERLSISQDKLGRKIGANRQTMQAAKRLPRSLTYKALRRFCDVAALTKEQARELEHEWLLDRIEVSREMGAASITFVEFVVKNVPAERMRAIFDDAIRAYRLANGHKI